MVGLHGFLTPNGAVSKVLVVGHPHRCGPHLAPGPPTESRQSRTRRIRENGVVPQELRVPAGADGRVEAADHGQDAREAHGDAGRGGGQRHGADRPPQRRPPTREKRERGREGQQHLLAAGGEIGDQSLSVYVVDCMLKRRPKGRHKREEIDPQLGDGGGRHLRQRTNRRAGGGMTSIVYLSLQEYVIVMVGNKKNMEQIAHDLVDFIGEESAEQFAAWLSVLLPTLEAQAQSQEPQKETPAAEAADETEQPQAEEEAPKDEKMEEEASAKRVISLKGLSSSSSEPPKKKIVSLGGNRGTIRSLNSSKSDMDDVIARRAQRFGIVEKKPAAKKSPSSASGKEDRRQRDESKSSGNKRRASERESGSKLSQRLGPPVNVDQAELDARDTMGSHKKRRNDRDRERGDDNHRSGGRGNRRNDRDRDHDMEDAGRGGKRRNSDSRDTQPPLPPAARWATAAILRYVTRC
ncbi:hypothetical protein ON010_g17971 [Phytophthora cinnamomi]|nr:hypothetical protein ON010_g17971 [Phytophthora cinnamomi]